MAKTRGFVINICCKDVPSSPSGEDANSSSAPTAAGSTFAEVTGLSKQMSTGSKPCNMLSFTYENGRVSVSPNAFIALML